MSFVINADMPNHNIEIQAVYLLSNYDLKT